MNTQYQRHSVYLKKYLAYLKKGIGQASLLGLCLAISAIAEPLINRDRSLTFAQTDQSITQLNNILAQAVFGDDQLTRYASAVNAIENKRLEIFRAAKNNSNWTTVANLAESQQTKVCDLAQPPEFLQDLCSQLRSFTEKEIHQRGFTNKEFNQITREQRQNPYLRGLIQAKQMELRKGK
ncbi:DUF4168 domain-containing protein [Pseudanabaena sp. ABRG5-3]|uniref:DUF4168 domain-containing protein n=1 Tax=Pseudanabaena sp. ABRG5-3 TaxID=685565 RepID=UPI000DC71057|nr:DUF4168 domain-containing protein [Pseudanabaena sp. ABRG5-3]BBC22898.1 hypothetical protein ABRG53_0641 [Pseudanabaena sp. ABRG5-3]